MIDTVETLEFDICGISGKTAWMFLRLGMTSGTVGLGEVTVFGFEAGVAQKLAAFRQSLVGVDIRDVHGWVEDRLFREWDELSRVVLSGIGQAAIDARAKSLGVSAQELIGGRRRAGIGIYANLNRGTVNRTPDGWAERARGAVSDGFRALKMAPFDGVIYTELDDAATRARVRHGIECVAAVRDAVGADIRLNVDCHARFNDPVSREVLRELAKSTPFWVEMPIPESGDRMANVRPLRALANDLGMRLAGAELVAGLAAVRLMIEQGAYDVYMPDLRFCGGVFEALRIAGLVTRAGQEFSLHNPAGPMLDLISAQVAMAAPSSVMIEHQYKEDPLHQTLLSPSMPAPVDGVLTLPDAIGWGAELDADILAEVRGGIPDATDMHGVPGAGNLA